MKLRDLAILAFITVEDLLLNDGYVVQPDAVNGGVKLATAADNTFAGVITTPADGSVDLVGVAVPGYGGTVRVKCGGAVSQFDTLTLMADGTVEANGAGTIIGTAMEDGVADEKVEATLAAAVGSLVADVATNVAAIDAAEVRLDALEM